MPSPIHAWVDSMFPNGGFFVEAGAHDGVGDSQTYALELTGRWSGLCIEPSLAFSGLRKSRTCEIDNRPLWACNTDVMFREVDGEARELSGITGSFQDDGWDRDLRSHRDSIKAAVTLTRLLDEHRAPAVIQFLALDTEGSEFAILGAHEFDRFAFETILVEHNGVESRVAELKDLLSAVGMALMARTECDALFISGGTC